MIKEYYRLMALQREHSRNYEDLTNQISDLRDKIVEKYNPGWEDIVVKVDDQYYQIGGVVRSIRKIKLVESWDE
jgi:hypothetical protein